MRIGIDGNEANVEKRVGSNHFAFRLIKALRDAPGDHHLVIYLKSPPVADMPQAVPGKLEYRLLKPGVLWTQWRLPLDLVLHRPRPDVFFTPGHYAPRFAPMPVMVTVLDLAFLKFPNLFMRYQRGYLQLKNWTAYSVRQATHVITISKNSKRDIIRAYHLDPSRISVVYPGIDLTHYHPAPPTEINRVTKQYGLGDKLIVAVGTIQPRKNYVRLLKAFDKLSGRYQKYELVVIGGRGWLTEDFDQTLKKMHKRSQVKVLGYIPDVDVTALMSAAACVCLVGLYEGFGLPAAQALACGTLPVVASTGSLPEVVGDSGVMVNPYSITSIRQGIMRAIRIKPEPKRQLVNQGARHIEQFNWPLAAKQVLEITHALTLHRPSR